MSFTLLDLWDKGRVDDAVATYFRLKTFSNRAMDEGREIHDTIAKHITQTGSLPEFMPKLPLKAPQPEKRLVVPYNDYIELSCYIDCLDEPAIFEYKTGVTEALEYVRSMQVPMYFLICSIAGIAVDRAYLINHNQRLQKNNFIIIWNDPHYIGAARNYIDTLGPEIFKFFSEEGLV